MSHSQSHFNKAEKLLEISLKRSKKVLEEVFGKPKKYFPSDKEVVIDLAQKFINVALVLDNEYSERKSSGTSQNKIDGCEKCCDQG